MFKIKRPVIIGLLLVLLVFTGYLNYQLTQQALLTTSKDYQNFEELELSKNMEDEIEVVQGDLSENDDMKDEIEVVDSLPGNLDIEKVVATGNKEIDMAVSNTNVNRDYFVEQRLSRDKLRANTIDRLDDIVNNSQTTKEVRSEAQKEIMHIGQLSEKELQIEGLVKSKGFEEAIVFLTSDDIKIVVSATELSEQDMVKILDIIKSETEFTADNIKIMKKQ